MGTILTSTARPQVPGLEQLVDTEKAFAKAAAETGVGQAFLEFCAEDGIVFQPMAVKARDYWQARPQSPALLAWTPVWADISADGTLGYTTGDWDYRPLGKEDAPVAWGQYITVWKKQSGGEFRAVLDIGISHPKPEMVASQWQSPRPFRAGAGAGRKIDAPKLDYVAIADLKSTLSDNIRLYRDGQFSTIGKANALQQIQSEQVDVVSGRVSDAFIAGTDDLMYGYGILTLTEKDGTAHKGNLMRIWKRQDDGWQIVLEVHVALAADNE
jgi:ketosteroid isomerase-like protein